ncbi:putative Ig domain-containing protein [Psychrosphaera algicola]|uniref:Ig domain-containing protein n=1 Tax=Psychrosphaera algicola TaxID=3023714 RepID=A0ABT5FFW6_9GAMM|nr:putative Ig domain-containing protein [Psychrosphaera sp. G1-22]MDC2890444.1 putative Ig domain-containing protein [Psychrosphaera sp. G1-22]
MKTIKSIIWLSCIFIAICFSSSSEAKVTYLGDNGVYEKIYLSNSVTACASCHYSGSSSYTDLSTYSKFKTHGSTSSSYIATGFMPYSDADLNTNEKNLISQWVADGSVYAEAPTVAVVTDIVSSKTSATLYASIDPNGFKPSAYVFNYSTVNGSWTNSVVSTSSQESAVGTGGGGVNSGYYSVKQVSTSLSGLSCGTTYYWRLYATNTYGTNYSSTDNFTTSACNYGPTISTTTLNNATEQTLFQQTISATDAESDTIQYALTTAPTGMTIGSLNGLISWTPTEEQSGNSYTVTVTATDSTADINATAQKSYTIEAFEVNDAPQITSTPVIVATEDSVYTYNPVVVDDDDSAFTFSLLSKPVGMSINASNGEITWTPVNGQTTSGSVIIKVSDNDATNEGTTTQTFSISVTAVNDSPTLTTTAVTTATEDLSYVYNVGATDEEGDTLGYELTTAPTGMVIGSSTGEINWTPEASAIGDNAVVVAISDGNSSISHNFTVTVTAVNDTPIITSVAVTNGAESVAYQYTVVATDEENDSLTFSLTTAPSGMSINETNGLITWTPAAAAASYAENVVVEVSDGNSSESQSFTINVIADDDAPFISSTAVTTATENTLYQYQLSVVDSDDTSGGANHVYTLLQAPEGMIVDTSGLISWTPSDEQTGNFDVQVRVRDGADNDIQQDIQSYSITVAAVNDAPIITSSPSTSAVRFVEYTYQVVATDVDDDVSELTFALTSTQDNMTLSASGLLTWTPGSEDLSSGDITIAVTDGGEDGAVAVEQTFVITVSVFNFPPEITSEPVLTATEDVLYEYQVVVEDIDDENNGTDINFELTNAPDGMSVTSTGLIQWTPLEGVESASAILLTVTDGGENDSQAATQAFDIVVTQINDAPTITSTPTLAVLEGQQWLYQLTIVDPDDDVTQDASALTTTVVSTLGNALNVTDSGALSWTPQEGDLSSGEIIITVTDGGEDGATSAVQTFTVSVTSVNQGPEVAAVTSLNATEDLPYQYTLEVTDPDDQNDGQEITYQLVSGPIGMTVSATGVIDWTPAEGQLTSGDVIIQVADGGEDGAEAASVMFVITVTAVNDAPVFDSSPITEATEGQRYTYQVTATDVDNDNDALIFSLLQGPTDMTIVNGELNWTPGNNAKNADIVVVVSDGELTVQQSFSIIVTLVNDAPSFDSQPITLAVEDTLYTYDIITSDIDSENLTLLLLSGPNGMTLVDNKLSWTPTEGVVTGSVNLSLSDGLITELQSFDIAVTAVNDAPEVSAFEPQQITELQSIAVQAISTDVDSTEVAWSLSGAPLGMSISANGLISWQAPQFSAGQYTIDVVADDGGDTNHLGQQTLVVSVLLLDGDGDLVADYADNCPLVGNTAQLDTDMNGAGDVCDSDDDGDGLSDEIELAFGLNPLDKDDALTDLDGDGLSNLDEYLLCQSEGDTSCSTFNRDNVPPVITVENDAITVVSTGLLTAVDFTGNATANDLVSGNVDATLSNVGPYRPGRYDLVWQARDAEGNVATTTQRLDVLPLISVNGTRVIGEDQAVEVTLRLNGSAPEYPVTVGFEVSGTASSEDMDLVNGSVVIEQGQEGKIMFSTFADTLVEEDESVLIQLTSVDGFARLNAIANQQKQTLMIVDRNVAPELKLVARQNAQVAASIYQDQGLVTVTASSFDANNDQITLAISMTNGVTFDAISDNEITFDPTLLDTAFVRVTATADDGQQVTTLTKRLDIVAAAPTLSASNDSDGDGITDADEGFGDSDGDKVPDYLDSIDEPSLIATSIGGDQLIATDGGLQLSLGELAAADLSGGALINQQNIVNDAGEQVADDGFSVIGGLYDFEVSGLNDAIRQARVVIPLSQSIPLNATYRKFDGSQWLDFVADANNAIASAKTIAGICPDPEDDVYTAGLTSFDNCIRLTLSDGGPNDADGVVNGVIVDPGGVAITTTELTVSFDTPVLEKPTEQPEGGSSMNMLWLLFATFLVGTRRNLTMATCRELKKEMSK